MIRVLAEASPPADSNLPKSDNNWLDWWLLVAEAMFERPRRLAPILRAGSDAYNPDNLDLYGGEDKLIDRLARAAYEMRDDALSRKLWIPFVSLSSEWNRWKQAFFEGWLSVPVEPVDVQRFVRRWRDMLAQLQNTLLSKDDELYSHALGIDARGPAYWGSDGPAIIGSMTDIFEKWIATLRRSWDLLPVARFLQNPACRGIEANAVEWMLKAATRISSDGQLDIEVGNRLAKLAVDIWSRDSSEIKGDPDRLLHFRNLVDLLASHHVPMAFELLRTMFPEDRSKEPGV
jgi:hypothetical protein